MNTPKQKTGIFFEKLECKIEEESKDNQVEMEIIKPLPEKLEVAKQETKNSHQLISNINKWENIYYEFKQADDEAMFKAQLLERSDSFRYSKTKQNCYI